MDVVTWPFLARLLYVYSSFFRTRPPTQKVSKLQGLDISIFNCLAGTESTGSLPTPHPPKKNNITQPSTAQLLVPKSSQSRTFMLVAVDHCPGLPHSLNLELHVPGGE